MQKSSIIVHVGITLFHPLSSLSFSSPLDLLYSPLRANFLKMLSTCACRHFITHPSFFKLTKFLASACIASSKLLGLSLLKPHAVKMKVHIFRHLTFSQQHGTLPIDYFESFYALPSHGLHHAIFS